MLSSFIITSNICRLFFVQCFPNFKQNSRLKGLAGPNGKVGDPGPRGERGPRGVLGETGPMGPKVMYSMIA